MHWQGCVHAARVAELTCRRCAQPPTLQLCSLITLLTSISWHIIAIFSLEYLRPFLELAIPLATYHILTMCYQVIELFSICRCLYYKHDINACATYGQSGHAVQDKTILVGNACLEHSGRQVKLDSDVGKRNEEASSEVELPKNNQAAHPTAITFVGPGTRTPSKERSLTPAERGKRAKKGHHTNQFTNADGDATDASMTSNSKGFNSKGSRASVWKRNLNKTEQVILQKIQDSKDAQLQLDQSSKGSIEVETTGGDSKENLLATDESQLAMSTNDILFGGDLEQRSLPVDPDLKWEALDLKPYEIGSVDDGITFDSPDPNLGNPDNRFFHGSFLIGLQKEEQRKKETEGVLL